MSKTVGEKSTHTEPDTDLVDKKIRMKRGTDQRRQRSRTSREKVPSTPPTKQWEPLLRLPQQSVSCRGRAITFISSSIAIIRTCGIGGLGYRYGTQQLSGN